MIPFLKSVAKAYASRYSDLSEFCFLFPNKRSGTFFLKYLKEEIGEHAMLSPKITTITDFVGRLSGRVVAGRLDLLFMLYEAYCELSGTSASEIGESDAIAFDSFRGWGETVLSDFSEVDQYLVSADEIFKNVKDYREISSNFLTDEQKEVLAEYFGRTDTGESTSFWKNFDKEDAKLSEAKRRFLHLWRIMFPLYERLNGKLEAKQLTTTGGSYRLAVEALQKKGKEALPYKKVVAVGFNALSTAENALFKELRDFDGYEECDAFADFFWDMTGPVLKEGTNSASKFVKANIRMFPCPEWALSSLSLSEWHQLPKLRVVSSPSNAAQTKIAGNLLAELRARISAEDITSAKVAVVLPDENLLLPMLYSLPEGMGNVNLTMGYPLRLTSVVPFVSLLRKLLYNMRIDKGEAVYYHRDLRLFLAHPFSTMILSNPVIGKIIKKLNREHRSVISRSELEEFSPVLGVILDPAPVRDSPRKVVVYLEKVLSIVRDKILAEQDDIGQIKLEANHIDAYIDALRRVGDIVEEYGVNLKPESMFYLTDRLIAGEKVGFEGEPLTGLQVMGTLETRSLDFDYLFILSMNEKVMPRRARTRTFIPNSLRKAYGMPPANYAESLFAYYFYRMISRAKEVTMVYDARMGSGLGGGDVSRYIMQLRYLFAKDRLHDQEWKFLLAGKEDYDPSVEKTEEVQSLLQPYLTEGGNRKFSATALNDYRECQTRFFYRHVLGINTDPEPSEFIDAIGVGNILHALMEELYVPDGMRSKLLDTPILITPEEIDRMIADREGIWKKITRIVNRLHFSMKDEDKIDTPIAGGPLIVAERIVEQAINILNYDRSIAPFRIYGSEIKELLRIPLPDGRKVNFKFAIDRLDEVMVNGEWRMRIVDYKTGSIKLEAADMEEVMTGGYKSEQIFQLFTYAWLLNTFRPDDHRMRNVITEIYDVPHIFRNEVCLPKISKEVVTGFGEYSSEFGKGMEVMLQSVFSAPDFEATKDESRCTLCAFKTLCRR